MDYQNTMALTEILTKLKIFQTLIFFRDALFFLRLFLIQSINGFDDNFFCYSEDIDISIRIKGAGYRLAYIKDAVVYHKVSASSGHYSKTKIYYKYRNKIYFLKKHRFPYSSTIYWYFISLKYALSLFLKYKRPKLAATILIALFDGTFGRLGKRNY